MKAGKQCIVSKKYIQLWIFRRIPTFIFDILSVVDKSVCASVFQPLPHPSASLFPKLDAILSGPCTFAVFAAVAMTDS